MRGHPRVTVLMPVRDGARHLEAAVHSILQQTWSDFELVIVDDGSRDRTPRLLSRLARCDRRIIVVRREAKGIVAALNAGLALARGEFVARMDADDIALTQRLERQVETLQARPQVVALGAALLVIDPKGRALCVTKPALEHDAIEAAIVRGGLGVGLAHPVVMARRRTIDAVGGYRARFEAAEDADLWLRMAERGRLANLSEVLLFYRLHPHSTGSQHHIEQAMAKRAVLEEAARRRGWPPERLGTPHLPTRAMRRSDLFRAWARMAREAGYAQTAKLYERKHGRRLAWERLVAEPWSVKRHLAMVMALLGPQYEARARAVKARLKPRRRQ